MVGNRKNSAIEPRYYMHGDVLEEVSSEKDLGVFASDTKVALHCRDSYSKANRMLGLISRTIRYRNPNILLNLYRSLVRPHVNYRSFVRTSICSSEFNIVSHVCFQNSEACHMKKGFVPIGAGVVISPTFYTVGVKGYINS